MEIEIVERLCRCGYCKFCIDGGTGSKFFQVYESNSPVCAGWTIKEAKAEYERLIRVRKAMTQ